MYYYAVKQRFFDNHKFKMNGFAEGSGHVWETLYSYVSIDTAMRKLKELEDNNKFEKFCIFKEEVYF